MLTLRRGLRRLTVLTVALAMAGGAASAVTSRAASPSVQSRHLCSARPGGIACMAQTFRATELKTRTFTPASAVPGYGPADLKAAYAVPDSTTTQTVAIVDAYGDATLEADLADYRTHYGLPDCTVANGCLSIVNEQGQSAPLPPTDAGWAGETSLDVDMVSAICPTCHILVVQADNADEDGLPHLEDAVNTAVRLGAKYVSMSWGGGESPDDRSRSGYALNHPGVVMVAAGGDAGYGSNWPASDPNVVSVGGTSLVRDANSTRGFTETMWNDGGYGATASGCSAVQPRPAWQNISSITALCDGRANNDVSVVADPSTGVAVVANGAWYVMGGTSAGAPMIAAMYAMAGPASSIAPSAYPYVHRSSFVDVTSGTSNCGGTSDALCTATTGWDGPTGVGVPQGLTGFTAVQPSAVSVHNPGNVVSYAGSAVRFDTHATDSQGLALTYLSAGLPAYTRVDSYGYVVGTPRAATTRVVWIRATDALGTAALTSFTWYIKLHRLIAMSTPHVSGTAAAGQTVYATVGSFRRDSRVGPLVRPAVHVRWYLDGRPTTITATSLRVPSSWRGHHLGFKVSASATYYATFGYATAYVTVR